MKRDKSHAKSGNKKEKQKGKKEEEPSYEKNNPDVDLNQVPGLLLNDVSVKKNVPYKGNDLVKILGVGGFNCAILTSRNHVYRVRMITHKHQVPMVVRGNNILKHLNEQQSHLGPGVLKLFGSGQFVKSLSDSTYAFLNKEPDSECKEKLIDNFEEDYYYYYEQMIEYINGSDLDTYIGKKNIPNTKEMSFMLIWFLQACQSLFQFQHRDIKPANILIKKLQAKKKFTFVKDKVVYELETRYVPYLVDFDQATFSNSALQKEHQYWTLAYVPPELLIDKKMNLFAYDWWSLGLTLLEMWINQGKIVSDIMEKAFIKEGVLFKNSKNRIKMILIAGCIQALIRNDNPGDDMKILESWTKTVAKKVETDVFYRAYKLFTTNPNLMELNQNINELSKDQRYLLQNMLHPRPEYRINMYISSPLFADFISKGKKKVAADFLFPSSKTVEYEDVKNKVF